MKIVYRVIAAIAVLLTIPALWFLKLIHVGIDIVALEYFLPEGGLFDDSFSLNQIYNFFKDKNLDFISEFELSEKMAELLAPLKTPAIVTLVFLALMLVSVLAVFFCSALTTARKINLGLSLFGAASTIGLMASFNHMTSLIADGTVGLDKIINTLLTDSESVIARIAGLFGAGGLVNFLGEVKVLQLTDATTSVLLIFVFIAMWTAAFIFIDMDEYKMPKQKKQHKKKHN